MKTYKQNLIASGIALLLFGIIVAIVSQSVLSYVIGGLGLFFVIIGCFAEAEEGEDEEKPAG